jgi:hypothetical protein
MSEEFPEPTDLRAICSALEHFSLPAALCSLEDNKLVVWNQLFQKGTGLSADELARTSLSSLILLEQRGKRHQSVEDSLKTPKVG